MQPPFRAPSQHHQITVTKGSLLGHVVLRPVVEDSASPDTDWKTKMNFDDQRLDIDPTIIILALGYASFLLTTIAWVASL
jgi:hypothetical protein